MSTKPQKLPVPSRLATTNQQTSLPSFKTTFIARQAIFKLALRNMTSRKLRTLLTLGGIVLGVAVVLSINITNDSTLDSVRTVFDEASGKAHLVITDSSAVPEEFSISALKQIERAPGVIAAVPSVNRITLTTKQAKKWPRKSLKAA